MALKTAARRRNEMDYAMFCFCLHVVVVFARAIIQKGIVKNQAFTATAVRKARYM